MKEDMLRLCIQALRESKHPERFTMKTYVHNSEDSYVVPTPPKTWCGSPACVLGHLASRPDLQQEIAIDGNTVVFVDGDACACGCGRRESFWYDAYRTREIFGLNTDELHELFGGTGCGSAETPQEAIDYIEAFIERKKAAALCDAGVY